MKQRAGEAAEDRAFKKSSHDARDKYFDVLKAWMVAYARAMLSKEYDGAVLCLRSQYNLVAPYCRPLPGVDIKKQLVVAEQLSVELHGMNRKDPAFQHSVLRKRALLVSLLTALDENIRLFARDLQLPTSEESTMDAESILDESDL